MKRLTIDNPQGNLKNALNLFFAKDGEAWVRGGGPAPAYEDITLNGYILNIVKKFAVSPQLFEDIGDETVAEIMTEWLYDGSSSMEGLIATLYTAGWAFAELRARLKDYEDTGLTPAEVTALRDRSEWIPVAVELPSEEEVSRHYAQYGEHPQYNVIICGGHIPTTLAFDGEGFYDSATFEPYNVSYWMPMPAPPEGSGTNE